MKKDAAVEKKRTEWQKHYSAGRIPRLAGRISSHNSRTLENEIVEVKLPKVKLEVMGNQAITVLVVIFFLLWIISLSFEAYVMSLQVVEAEDVEVARVLLLFLGTISTIAVSALGFVVVVFTQRIMVRSCWAKKKKRALPQQIMVIALSLVWFLVPEYSIFGVISFWNAYAVSARNNTDFGATVNDLDSIESNSASVFIVSLLQISATMFIRIFGEYTKGLHAKIKRNEEKRAVAQKELRRERLRETYGFSAFALENDDDVGLESEDDDVQKRSGPLEKLAKEEREEHAEDNTMATGEEEFDTEDGGMMQESLRHKKLVQFRDKLTRKGAHAVQGVKDVSNHIGVCSCYYLCCCWICCSRARCTDETSNRSVIRKSVRWRFVFFHVFYIFLFLILSSALQYEPSIIPFFGMITVLRVCSTKDSAGNLYCSVSAYPTSFGRALASTVLFVLEAFCLLMVIRISRESRKSMSLLPYGLNRSNFLGYSFFVALTVSFCIAASLLCLLEVSVPPTSDWIYSFTQGSSSSSSYVITVDPLYQVGVTSGTFAFGNITLMVSAEICILAFAFLPADSVGFLGWFVPSSHFRKKTKQGLRSNMNGPDDDLETIHEEASEDTDDEDDDEAQRNLKESASMDEDVLLAYFDANPVFVPFEDDFNNLLLSQSKPAGSLMGSDMFSKSMREIKSELGDMQNCTDGKEQVTFPFQQQIDNLLGYESTNDFHTPSSSAFDQSGVGLTKAYNAITGNEADISSMLRFDPAELQRLQSEGQEKSERLLRLLKMAQVQSHVLVFQTEMLLFNFTNVAYSMSTAKKRIRPEREAAMIEAPEMRLLKHVVHKETDTHAIVAVGPDRVVIAFRGTVTGLNVKTDLDLRLVEWDLANSIEPVPQAATNPLASLYAEKEAKVHGGFLEAYRSVAAEIKELVDPYLYEDVDEEDNGKQPKQDDKGGEVEIPIKRRKQSRALFCTGHSLGGGLAVICAFDLAAEIYLAQGKSSVPAVGITTFGCPRVGNFSFQQRLRRIVPTANRFVLATDIIPKTPPRLCECSGFGGYHHVGLQLLLDLRGNLLIGPNVIEIAMFHGLARPNKTRHFTSRYALALLFFYGRLGVYSKDGEFFWVSTINKLCKFAGQDILNADVELVRNSFPLFFQDGVTFTFQDVQYKTSSCQTESSKQDEEAYRVIQPVKTAGEMHHALESEKEGNASESETTLHDLNINLVPLPQTKDAGTSTTTEQDENQHDVDDSSSTCGTKTPEKEKALLTDYNSDDTITVDSDIDAQEEEGEDEEEVLHMGGGEGATQKDIQDLRSKVLEQRSMLEDVLTPEEVSVLLQALQKMEESK